MESRSRMRRRGIARIARASLFASILPGCASRGVSSERLASPPAPPEAAHLVECRHGVVVSVSAPASEVGLSILRQGGNAADAAIATVFALAVAYPLAGNLGGGGFMLVHPAPGDGEPVAFNYREAAPAAAWPTMFTKEESQFTHRAVATPGTVRGMALVHRRFASLPWSRLLAPAIAMARDGFVVDKNLAESLNVTLADAPGFAEFQRVFGKPGGGPWSPGDRMTEPDLARTLQTLSDLGPDAFYTGSIAREIVAEMERGKGLVTAADLASYHAVERKALTTRFHGTYDVYVPPPPSSGGICLLEEINMLESFDLKASGSWTPRTLHTMAETMRRACCDRARYLGDPAFVDVPTKLLDPAYARQVAATIDLEHATRSATIAPDLPLSPEGESTTHFSILDERGMAVANTYTLERRWGSRIVVQNTGILLNNDMRAFNLFPGFTDSKGTIGTAPNTIAPGKRPLSSMCPTIVAKNGRVVLVTGSPGSRAIPHTVLEILENVFEHGMTLQQAVDAPRFSHEWYPDQILVETPELFPDTMKGLETLGHTIVKQGPFPQGDAHSIQVLEPHAYVGVADRRLSGCAAGY